MLCLSAQSNPQGVPKELLEAKKLELIQEKVRSGKHQLCRIQLIRLLDRCGKGSRRSPSSKGAGEDEGP